MNYQEIINRLGKELETYEDKGQIATYISELGKVNPNQFGVHLTSLKDENYGFGDFKKLFSIQSIAKVFSLTLAYNLYGEDLWKRVGVEPSGTKYNSLIQLELEQGIPRNPLINPGAIVICDLLISKLESPKEELLLFIRGTSNDENIHYLEKIAQSENETGFTNRALVNLMKSFGNIHNPVEEVLDLYFHLCSIEMSCSQVSRSFLYLADNGYSSCSKKTITTNSKSNRINSIMQLCGFYDEAGEFAFRVGLPGKSGVGGGIVAIKPGFYSVAVWSPKLNKKGNSSKGMAFLEKLTTETDDSIF